MRLASSASRLVGIPSSARSASAACAASCSTKSGTPSAASRIAVASVVVEHLALRERVDEEPGLVAAERVEYRGALAPRGAPLEELGPRHRDDEHGAVDGADDVLDEVEEGRDGPVEVVEHDDDRAPGGEVPEERAGGRERRVGALELAERGARPRRARRHARPARGAAGT